MFLLSLNTVFRRSVGGFYLSFHKKLELPWEVLMCMSDLVLPLPSGNSDLTRREVPLLARVPEEGI